MNLNTLEATDEERGLVAMITIVVESVDAFLSKKQILNNISFQVNKGELVGLQQFTKLGLTC